MQTLQELKCAISSPTPTMLLSLLFPLTTSFRQLLSVGSSQGIGRLGIPTLLVSVPYIPVHMHRPKDICINSLGRLFEIAKYLNCNTLKVFETETEP